MARPATYEITSTGEDVYVDGDPVTILAAIRSVLGAPARAHLDEGGMRVRWRDLDCVVSATPFVLRFTFEDDMTTRQRERLLESLIRRLEVNEGQPLDWSSADGRRNRQVDAVTGEIVSPGLESN